MNDTPTLSEVQPKPALHDVLRRAAVPFFLFAAVLATLLALSYLFLLPIFTRVAVNGTKMTFPELRDTEQRLTADLQSKEQDRDQSILPMTVPEYEELRSMRASTPSFLSLRDDVLHEASALAPEKDAVHVSSLFLNETDGTFTLIGDVRNVGDRSMTVLASFVRELTHLPFVAKVSAPTFERRNDPPVGKHSPFTILLKLR